ncbi:MAG: hypothetical protein ACLFV7_09765 [Phycisphaerae bacterium]
MNRAERWLRIWLRAGGAFMLLAVAGVVMPPQWMDSLHRQLGLGPLPSGAIVDYLARITSAAYAAIGGLMLLASADVKRYRPFVTYALAAPAVMALAVWAVVNFTAPNLRWWLLADVASAGLFCVVGLALQRRATRDASADPAS